MTTNPNAATEGSSLQGDNVCVYRITETGVQEISDKGVFTVLREGFEHLISSSKNSTAGLKNNEKDALIIKKCCPGYHSLNNLTCVETRVSNPFSESQFSYALIYLGILLVLVGVISMFVAYRYHYRFQRNQKHGLISNNYDDPGVLHSVECQPIPATSSNSNSRKQSPQDCLMEP
uniref:Uncharacterized protein n=1 Tax=Panagrolaimus sp. PS1159 TaxID=55785 RepID=A0AC35FJ50_9BILA